MDNIIFSKYSNDRAPSFRIRTDIVKKMDGSLVVRKSPQSYRATEHVEKIYSHYQSLKEVFKDTQFYINECTKENEYIQFEYIEGITLESKLDECLGQNDFDGIKCIIEKFSARLKDIATEKFVKNHNFISVFGDINLKKESNSMRITDVDMIFSNIYISDQGWNIIDYEWTFDFLIPVNYVIYRSIFYYVNNISRNHLIKEDLYGLVGIAKDELVVYEEMEEKLQNYILNGYSSLPTIYSEINCPVYSMKNIVDGSREQYDRNTIQIFYDYGDGYSITNSEYISNCKNSNGEIEVNVSITKDMNSVRIDPTENMCTVRLIESTLNNDRQMHCYSNGYQVDKSFILFNIKDPQLIFLLEKSEEGILHIRFTCEKVEQPDLIQSILQSEEQIREGEKTINTLKNEYERQDRELHERLKKISKQEDELRGLKSEVQKLGQTILDCEKLISQKDNTIKEQSQQIEDKNQQIEYRNQQIEQVVSEKNTLESTLEAQLTRIQQMLNESNMNLYKIQQSKSWKMTKPFRSLLYAIKGNKYTHLFARGIHCIFLYGPKATFKQTIYRIQTWNKGGQNTKILEQNRRLSIENLGIDINNVEPLRDIGDKRIAIHVHLYYVDLLDEFIGYLNNMPYSFDLFISCRESSNVKLIHEKSKQIPSVQKVIVKEHPNRGRDIAPLYVMFRNEVAKYDYFMHIHSKKSLYTGNERKGWRQYSLESLLGSPELISKIFAMFENYNAGLIYPDIHEEIPMMAYSWLSNEYRGKQLLNRMGILDSTNIFNYPAGSFFWARTEAIQPIFDLKLSMNDFDVEAGQTDGTLAHALERVLPYVSTNQQYNQIILDCEENVFRINQSLKPYQNYFQFNKEKFVDYLRQFDVISFDIFDTLVSRCIYKPDDIFIYMNKIIEERYKIEIDFLKVRKSAEQKVWERKQAFTNIDDIYQQMMKDINISQEIAKEWKELEIYTEKQFIVPRRDMLYVFNKMKEYKKKVIIVSDMYLTKPIVEEILASCGYNGYDELWVSSDVGLRKDTGTIWNAIFEKYYNLRFVHIGDNFKSDWQNVINYGHTAEIVLSGHDEFTLSPLYKKLASYAKMSIENSIILGSVINNGLFNSPFAFNQSNGRAEFNTAEELGYSIFGPLLTYFVDWTVKNAESNTKLLLLAREGYMFEKIYDEYFSSINTDINPKVYFLTSRRAVTLAAVNNEQDLRELLGQYYVGSLSNCLRERIGIELRVKEEDRYIELPRQLDELMSYLQPYKEEIIECVSNEKAAYLEYISSVITSGEKLAVVDVGFSGTIQYFLMKLLDEKIDGYYIATHTTKPDKIGGKCFSIYPVTSPDEIPKSKILKYQLFLEAALSAPYGQLIRFKKKDNKVIPLFKEKENMSDEIANLQNGIINYSRRLGRLFNGLPKSESSSKDLVQDIFYYLIDNKTIPEKLAEIFCVQDAYCSNGTQKYNADSGSFDVV